MTEPERPTKSKVGRPTREERRAKKALAAIERSIDRLPAMLDAVTARAIGGNSPDSIQPQLVQSALRLVEIVPGVKERLDRGGSSAASREDALQVQAQDVLREVVARARALEEHYGKSLIEILGRLTDEDIRNVRAH
jgi:hypothetical protein